MYSMNLVPDDVISAVNELARLDITLSHTQDKESLYFAPMIKKEAMAIAALEGNVVRAEIIHKIDTDRDASNYERTAWSVINQVDALRASQILSSLHAAEVRGIFEKSDAASGRLMNSDRMWTLESDSEWMEEEFAIFMSNPKPLAAIELIRKIWISGKFFGLSRRMALIFAPLILQRGFSCTHPVFGMASYVAKNVDFFKDASQDEEEWARTFFANLEKVMKLSDSVLSNSLATKMTLEMLCPPQTASSSLHRAIVFCISTPIFTTKALCAALDVSQSGAKVITTKLLSVDIIETDGSAKNRNFICRRAL